MMSAFSILGTLHAIQEVQVLELVTLYVTILTW